ncbi:MAG: HIT domain-containing protein, partial [Clostridia bacterium]|nr:HIT domain-containing protein [Clostridia bacterium]
MSNCIFCKIIGGEIPAKKVYKDEDMIIINDINPQAPIHMLLIPKAHYA